MRLIFLFTILFSLNCFAQEKLRLELKKWHKIDNELQIQVIQTLNDSRCPHNARCVWAGEVTIEAEFNLNEKLYKLNLKPATRKEFLTTSIEEIEQAEKPVNAFKWKNKSYKLIAVMPYPGKPGKTEFTFEISQ